MAYFHRPCESYFIESHDDHVRSYEAERRERKRQTDLYTQSAIATELSQLVSEDYREDIVQHMEKMEVSSFINSPASLELICKQMDTLPDVASIDIQSEIQWFMRPYLLDFLIEAHSAFSLIPETLFLTINLLDRYCSRRIVYKRHYQLVGCSALLIAAKYGDRKEHVPTIKELRCMCCSLYDDDMFTQMEWHVLQTLGWSVGHPTIDSFLQLALEDLPSDPEVENMARYISEIAMFSKDFVSKRPSDMARCSLTLARCILDRPQASPSDWVSQYDSQTLITLSQQLHRPSTILSRKYAANKCARVSITLEAFLARQASIARCYDTPPTPPSDVPSSTITEMKGTNSTSLSHQQQQQQQRQQYGPPPVTSSCLTPIHKGGPGNQFSFNTNGCLTPPITPLDMQRYGPPPPPPLLAGG